MFTNLKRVASFINGESGTVPSVKVILSLDNQLLCEAIQLKIQQCPDVKVVAEADSPAALLKLVEEYAADAVILPVEDEKMPGVLTHLFNEYPNILALAIAPAGNQAVVYQQQITSKIVDSVAIVDVLKELKHADTEYWVEAQ